MKLRVLDEMPATRPNMPTVLYDNLLHINPQRHPVHFPVAHDGRWLVCREVPGTGTYAVVEDCLTLEAALQVSRELSEGTRPAATASQPDGRLHRTL